MPPRPRLTPAIADIRRAVRASLAPLGAPAAPGPENEGELPAIGPDGGDIDAGGIRSPSFSGTRSLVLVALSGGPDSLALAAATAFEAPRAGLAAGAVIVDHGLQEGSADVAARAADQARGLGLAPVLVRRVDVGDSGGPESAARAARYAALDAAADETGAIAVLLGHTLDDQAETVLLGLARGSGAGSLLGMPAVGRGELDEPATARARPAGRYRRPLLGIRRSTTEAFCADSALVPWRDPHNGDPRFARVRVRTELLPELERSLGPGVAEALARTAEQLAEDAEALDHLAEENLEEIVELEEAGLSIGVALLAANPAALRQRIIRAVVEHEFHVGLSRRQTLEVARLVTDWHGQGPLDLPGLTAQRRGGRIHLISTRAGDLTGQKPPAEH
ncbi:tRNA lysidine(34) synthetase TilS [Galbitalea sp. SE-J8]|uniref:tRNA lysidine(34) synthetase TilS n=1 Tax=Galbitalea sp. SE-J8 TaxID=3054952 RepID=UPI00259C7D47|nr:tRNA lysidine(34) synthetase TilS [Galbitalea sp. SE-J8]MDM4761653.1 tRNA lysidine(34) synthetase TilS [Galbitalea sp. SE-J8]